MARLPGIPRTATTRNNRQAEFDTVSNQLTDFIFVTWIKHHKRVFNSPVGGIGDVRNTGKTIEADIVFTGMFRQ